MYLCSNQSLEEKIKSFSSFGKNENGGITRLSLTKAALDARAEFCKRCKALNMTIKTDDIGNIYATMNSQSNLPAIAIGSHVDSVVNGGNYDGILGVLAGLEVAETIVLHKIELQHPLTIIVWTNEEGARFEPAMMSSGIIANKFRKEDMLSKQDANGISFATALEDSGYKGESRNRLNKTDYAAYLELHIEQGPVLEEADCQVGVVQGVVGMVNYEFCLEGVPNHAGTTPQYTRKDALLAASKLIQKFWDTLPLIDSELVFTIGRMNILPNIHTVIPGEVRFTLDVRHKDPLVLKKVIAIIETLPLYQCGCKLTSKLLWKRDTVHFDSQLIHAVQSSAEELKLKNISMYSGAGHDAQYIADIIPSSMIFVPSKNGRSHCPEEYTLLKECACGNNVLLNALLKLDKTI